MENVNDKNVTNIQDEPVGIGTGNAGIPIKPKFFTAKTITIILVVAVLAIVFMTVIILK